MANHVHAYRSVIVHGLLSLHCIVESLPLSHNAQHVLVIIQTARAFSPLGGSLRSPISGSEDPFCACRKNKQERETGFHGLISYRNVMRDVTRLLYLLNKRSSAIEIPPDGLQLLSWSEQILQRYLVSQVHIHIEKFVCNFLYKGASC